MGEQDCEKEEGGCERWRGRRGWERVGQQEEEEAGEEEVVKDEAMSLVHLFGVHHSDQARNKLGLHDSAHHVRSLRQSLRSLLPHSLQVRMLRRRVLLRVL